MPVSAQNLTILESVNILLAVQGEAPVTSATGTEPFVTQALATLFEVSRNEQAKGWWFNQQTTGNFDPDADVTIYTSTSSGWHAVLPHEFIYYATIRASRVHQRRVLGSETIEQFTAAEEAVALATLQQAHVRNSNAVYDFNDWPAELKGVGVDEILFLKGSVEEKVGLLKAGTELLVQDKTRKETAIQLAPELARFENEATIDTFQDYPTELRMLGYTEEKFYELPAWKKTEALRDATKLRTARATVTTETEADLELVNSVLLSLGEAPVTACNDNAMASEVWRLLYDTDKTLQHKDWFFNTEEDSEITPDVDGIVAVADNSTIISIDPDLAAARMRRPRPTTPIHSGGAWFGGFNPTTNTVTLTNEEGFNDVEVGDIIYIQGISFIEFTPAENALVNGYMRVSAVTGQTIVYEASASISVTASYNSVSITDLYVASRLLYNADENTYDWGSGAFTASVRYRRALYDVPEAYLEMLKGLTGLRLAETYPKAKFETQRLAEAADTGRAALLESESRMSDFNIFDNYDVAIRLGRHRPSHI